MKRNLYCILAFFIFTEPLYIFAQTNPNSKTLPAKKPATQPASKTLPAKKPVTQSPKPTTSATVKKTVTSSTSKSSSTPSTVKTPDNKTALPSNPPASKNQSESKTALPSSQTSQTVQPSNKTSTHSSVPTRTASTNSSSSAGKSRVSYSSSSGYAKGDNLLNVGIGLSSYYYGNPIGISFEKGIEKDISVGGQLDYNSGNYYGYSSGYKAYYLGARGSIHLCRLLKINVDKLDLYAGLGLGYRHIRWNDSYYGYNGGLFFNYFIGGKYYFAEKFGGFAELGYTGLSSVRVGLALKF